jgi:asparagine synthase (glutamine-hydrolysing)
VPIWINRAFAQRTGLFDRAARCVRDVRSAPPQQGLTGSGWSYLLASADAGRSGMPIDFRHPFMDVRLLEWAVKVPEPVLRDKAVLRASMAGLLPPRVLARPKTLLGNAAAVAERKHPAVVRRHDELLRTVPCIAEYVDVAILKRCLDDPNTRLALGLNRFEIVALWLASRVDRGTGPRYCRGVD